jgi:hypothetical protein
MNHTLLASPTFATFLVASLVLAITPAALAPAMKRRRGSNAYGRYLAAASFIGLGIYAALASPRTSR